MAVGKRLSPFKVDHVRHGHLVGEKTERVVEDVVGVLVVRVDVGLFELAQIGQSHVWRDRRAITTRALCDYSTFGAPRVDSIRFCFRFSQRPHHCADEERQMR